MDSTVKKSVARILCAWLRSSPQVGPDCRGPDRARCDAGACGSPSPRPSSRAWPARPRSERTHIEGSPSHPKDRLPNVIGEWRPPAGGVPTVGPLPADELAVPAQERLRAHYERRPTRAKENPADRRHEQPVSTAKARPPHLALEHRELMAKDHDLDVVVQVAGRAGRQPDCPAH